MLKQPKNVSTIEKIVNLGVENHEVLNAIFEIAKNNETNIIVSLIYLVGKGNQNAIKAIYALSNSDIKVATNALGILSESNAECQKAYDKEIDRNIKELFSDSSDSYYKTIIDILENAAITMNNEKAIDALIKNMYPPSTL